MPMSSNMLPHLSNTHIIGGSDVRSQERGSNQNVPQATQEEFPSYVISESQSSWQGPAEEPDDPQLQQQKQFWRPKQEIHEAHRQFIQQQHRQSLEFSMQQNMREESRIGYPETSYSALLHGPDTPPSQLEPGWDTPLAKMENHGAKGLSWSRKGVPGNHEVQAELKDQGSLYVGGCRPELAFNPGTPHIFPEQFKSELNLPSQMYKGVSAPQTFDVESTVNSQRYSNPFSGHKIKYSGGHLTEQTQVPKSFYQSNYQQVFQDPGLSQQRSLVFPDQKDGQQQSAFQPLEGTNASLQSTGQSSMQLQQHGARMSKENRSMGFRNFQSQENYPEGITYKQQEVNSFPFRGLPTGHAPNDFGLQQHNYWNAPQGHAGFENNLQPPADAYYNGWGMSVWQEGSATMQMRPNYVQYGWQGGPADMSGGFLHINPEGYYSSAASSGMQGASFGSGPAVIPSPIQAYNQYQGPQVNHVPANQFTAGVRMAGNGAGHNSTWTGFCERQDAGNQLKQEISVDACEQVRQLRSNHVKGPQLSHLPKNVMNSQQEQTPDGSGDKESSSCQKDVDLEGPQVKKQRESPELTEVAFDLKSVPSSSSFSQKQKLRQGPSTNLRTNLHGEGTLSRRNVFCDQGLQIASHSALSVGKDQPVFNSHGLETELDQESRTSGEINCVLQGPGIPCHSSVLTSTQVEIPVSLVSHSLHSSENSVWPEQATNDGHLQEKFVKGLTYPFRRNHKQPSNSIGTTQDQPLVDLLMKQLGERAQVSSSSGLLKSSVTSLSMISAGPEKILSETGRPSNQGVVIHEMPVSQCFIRKPSNVVEDPNPVSMSTSAQLRGVGRPEWGKFLPPPPYQSQPVQSQGESGRPSMECSEEQPFSEAWAPRIYESTLSGSGKKEMTSKPVSFQSHPGIMGNQNFYHPVGGDSLPMGATAFFAELKGTQKQAISSSEVVSASNQQAADINLYAHTQSPDVHNNTHLRSMAMEVHESTRNEQTLVSSQASAYPGPILCGRGPVNLAHTDGDQNQFAGYNGHHVEYAALRNGQRSLYAKVAPEQLSKHLTSKSNTRAPITLHSKKRKKPVSFILPWHIAASQPRGQLSSVSKAELMWASAANRLPEKDGGEVLNEGVSIAESRLRSTTQLMQQLISPLPSVLMHGNKPIDFEPRIYSLAKFTLGEACRLIAGAEREMEPARKALDIKTMTLHGQTRVLNMRKDIAMTRLVESFMERVKHLDFELARFDCSMSALELRAKIHDLEKLSIVNRLGKYHGAGFSIEVSENKMLEGITSFGPGIRRPTPQRYVIAVPMSRTLPEGVRCLSL